MAPYLRSQTQALLLAELLLKPDISLSVTELAGAVNAPQSVVSKEVNRLVKAGVLTDERVGRTRLIRADTQYRLIEPLTQILAATYGPEPVMSSLLSEVPNIDKSFIYGSWAARLVGVPGGPPGDVDVLVVGSPDRAALNEAARQAEARLGMPVQITRISRDAWEHGDEPFIRTVQSKPLIQLASVKEKT